MTKPFASATKVPIERSKVEIDLLLQRHGATKRGIQVDDEARKAIVAFALEGRLYRMELPLPDPNDGKANRVRWRAVVLLIKTKLEVIRIGVSTPEREFLADLVLPDGSTAHFTIDEYMRKLFANGYTAPLSLPEARS